MSCISLDVRSAQHLNASYSLPVQMYEGDLEGIRGQLEMLGLHAKAALGELAKSTEGVIALFLCLAGASVVRACGVLVTS